MKIIPGHQYITIHATAGETYKIEYVEPPLFVNILNLTDDYIFVNNKNEFVDVADGAAGHYVAMRDDMFTNGLRIPTSNLYIRADGNGSITINIA